MKKSLISPIITTLLVIFCTPLSGAQTPIAQAPIQKNQNVTITVQPSGGYFNITESNRAYYENYFKTFGIILDKSTNKVIPITIKEQKNAKRKLITINKSSKWITKTPEILPLDIFTQADKRELNSTISNCTIIYTAFALKNNLKSHNELMRSTNQQERINNNIIKNLENAAQQFQKKLISNQIPLLTFLNLEQEQENNLNELLDHNLLTESKLLENLENNEILQCTENLKTTITNYTLKNLAKLLFTATHLNLTQKIPTWSFLKEIFVDKLIKELYPEQIKIITKFNNDLNSELLVIFLKSTKIAKKLKKKYENLKKKALPEKPVLDISLDISKVFSIENNKDLTLEKALLINHLLTTNDNLVIDRLFSDPFPKNLTDITNEMVTEPVNKIFKKCIAFQDTINLFQKLKPIIEQKEIDEYFSYKARFARLIIQCKQFFIKHKKPLLFSIVISCCASVLYLYQNQLKSIYIEIFKLLVTHWTSLFKYI